MVDSSSSPSEGAREAYSASEGHRSGRTDHASGGPGGHDAPAVGYLTIVFASDVSAAAAKHLIDEIAAEAISYEAVEGVRCDVAEFSQPEIDAFWQEALS